MRVALDVPFGGVGHLSSTAEGIRRILAELIDACDQLGIDAAPTCDVMARDAWYVPGTTWLDNNGRLNSSSGKTGDGTKSWGGIKSFTKE